MHTYSEAVRQIICDRISNTQVRFAPLLALRRVIFRPKC
jgi:hypothetical protein